MDTNKYSTVRMKSDRPRSERDFYPTPENLATASFFPQKVGDLLLTRWLMPCFCGVRLGKVLQILSGCIGKINERLFSH